MTIDCIIVEDEPLALQRLQDYVSKVPFLKLLASFDNAMEAIGFLQTQVVDLLFLDIQMDGLTGIQLLEALSNHPQVIITTAFDTYAIRGFELNVCDYLLKPYSFERFVNAVTKVYDKIKQSDKRDSNSFVFIRTENRYEKLRFEDILFIEGMRDYRKIHTLQKKIMTLQTFSELAEQLPRERFCRVHKSYLIAVDKIESIERERIKIQEEYIPVSKTYKEEFLRRVNII